MTRQQTLHLRAFRASLGTAGRWVTHGAETFEAIIGPLQYGDPRMLDTPEARLELVTATDDLPSPAPVRGDVITTAEGSSHRIVRLDSDAASGLTTCLLAAP